MRTLLLLAMAAGLASAQTTITGTINNIDGTAATGTVHITLNQSCTTAGGLKIGAGNPKIVSVVGGVFSTTLYPNDTCIPSGTSYTVRYLVPRPPNGGRAKYWVVPTSGSPVNISSVEFDAPPIPGTYMPISQLTGCTNGQTITHNGTSFVCGTASGLSSLNGLTGTSQTFAKVDDANVTLGIASSGTTHTFTMGWSGTLAKARLPGVTAFLDAAQTYTAGMRQTFTHDGTNAGIRIGSVASDPSGAGNGDIWNNAGALRFHDGSAARTLEHQGNKGVNGGYLGLDGTGRASKANQHGQTVYADQDITYSSGSIQNMAAGHLIMPERTVAGLPAAGTVSGRIYIATDATSASTCSSGGGSARAVCRSNGSVYEALGGQALLWGSIGGTLSNQTDLQNALNGKLSTSGNAASATQLAADGTNCSAGAYPRGVDQFGSSQDCGTDIAGNAATATALAADPADCSGGQFVVGYNAAMVPTCGTPVASLAGYAADISSATTWTVAGATHAQQTADLDVRVRLDNGTEYVKVDPAKIRVNKSTYTVTVTWDVATAGRIAIKGSGGYKADMSSGTTWSVTGATHNQQTADVNVRVWLDNGTEYVGFTPASIKVNKSSFDVTVTLGVAQAGRIQVDTGGGGSGAGGGGESTSVANSGATGASVLKTGTNVTARKIKAGANCTVTENTDDIEVTCTGGGSGDLTEVQAGANISVSSGTGPVPIVALASSVDLGAGSLEIPNGTSLPGTCTVGQTFFDSDATSGQRFYACESTNTWVLQGDGGGGGGSGDLTEVQAGNGISITSGTGPIPVIAVSSAVLSGTLYTLTVDVGSMANGTCWTSGDIAATGVGILDAVTQPIPYNGFNAGITLNWRIEGSNNLRLQACNNSGGTVDPASGNFRAAVLKAF